MGKDLNKADIVVLGHVAKDIIEIDGKSVLSIGGAVYYGGIAGSHMGLKIIIITHLKNDDFPILKEFEKHGVKYLAYPSDETSGIRNIYSSKNQEIRTCKPLGHAGLFKKEEIPEIKTKYFICGPILAGEIDIPLLNYITDKYHGKVCLDIQGFVRVVVGNDIIFSNLSQEDKKKILEKINILKVDHAEAEALTDKEDIEDAAKDLVKLGPKEVLLTHEKGISVYANNKLCFFPWKNKFIKGRTGRGDTAFISYVGSRIKKNPEESLKFATALTSLKLEIQGPFILPLNVVEEFIKKAY